jgi:uncharacterized cupredoxin-like copper-binding protein
MKLLIAVLATLGTGAVMAHEGHRELSPPSNSTASVGTPFGMPGDPARATSTVRLDFGDAGCDFAPDVRLRQGEVVLFVVRNSGSRLHELVIGTSHELAGHAAQSAIHPDADHDEPYILHIEPGATRDLAWRFTRVGLFRYGCLVRGTAKSAMAGSIAVTR